MMELTLLLPLFLIFWFGIIDWGIAFFVHQTIVYRTTAAARWAVVDDYNPTKIAALLKYGDPNSSAANSPWWSVATSPTVDVQLLGSDATKDHRVQITVSNYQWMHFTPFFAGRYLGKPVRVTLPTEDLKDGI